MTLELRVVIDEDPGIHPRHDCDNLGTMSLFHKRYNLGDKARANKPQLSLETALEVEKRGTVNGEPALWLPVYMYNHSGITINTTGFSCPWDSGRLGIVWCTIGQARAWFNWPKNGRRLGKKQHERVMAALEAEVKEYDDYLTGNVWGWTVVDTENNDEHVDSCWGYIGDSGKEFAEIEGKKALEYQVQRQKDLELQQIARL